MSAPRDRNVMPRQRALPFTNTVTVEVPPAGLCVRDLPALHTLQARLPPIGGPLHLRRLPALRVLEVEGPHPAEVHLRLLPGAPTLRIVGSVGVLVLYEGRRRTPIPVGHLLEGGRPGPVPAFAVGRDAEWSEDVDLVVRIGPPSHGAGGAAPRNAPRPSRLRALAVVQDPGARVDVPAGVRRAWIHGTPALRTVRAVEPLDMLTVTHAPHLRRVSADGDRVAVERCVAETLALGGPWQHAELRAPRMRRVLLAAERVVLRGVVGSVTVHNALHHTLEADGPLPGGFDLRRRGDPAVVEEAMSRVLSRLVGGRCGGAAAPPPQDTAEDRRVRALLSHRGAQLDGPVIHVLLAGVAQALPPRSRAWVWELRDALEEAAWSGRPPTPHAHAAGRPWGWRYGEDPVGRQAWLADFALWEDCAPALAPEVREPLREGLTHVRDPRFATMLAEAWRERARLGQSNAALEEALVGMLARWSEADPSQPVDIPSHLVDQAGRRLARLAGTLRAAQASPARERLLCALVAGLGAGSHGTAGLKAISYIAFEAVRAPDGRGVWHAAVTALASVQASTSRWPPEARALALRLALQAARDQGRMAGEGPAPPSVLRTAAFVRDDQGLLHLAPSVGMGIFLLQRWFAQHRGPAANPAASVYERLVRMHGERHLVEYDDGRVVEIEPVAWRGAP